MTPRRSTLLAAGLATAVAPLLSLPIASAGAPAAPADLGWVTGTVVDAHGDPVEGALVDVLPPREIPELGLIDDHNDRWAVTGADGKFRVRQDQQGFLVQVCDAEPDAGATCTFPTEADYLVRYVGPDGAFDSWVQHTDLYDGSTSDLSLGQVEVQPPARIKGVLEGAEHEQVQVMRLNDTVALNSQTDGDGRFTFKGLAPGRYYVRAGGYGTLPWQSEPVTIDATHPGKVTGTLEGGTALVGKAYDDATGAPARRTEIFLANGEGEPIASLVTGRSGTFRFTGLVPGDYQVGHLLQGGAFVPHVEDVTIGEEAEVHADVPLVRGASATVRLRGTDGRVDSELRDRRGNVLYPNLLREDGVATYPGLAPGRYRLVVKDGSGYGVRAFRVRAVKTYALGRLRLDQPLLTLRGRTAPRAVVEATTSDLCPADSAFEQGGFHEIEQADASGRYVIHGLVPGEHWMIGSDGFPGNFAAICHDDVVIAKSQRYDVPLAPGNTLTGRFVYAGTDRPVITNVGYDVTYPGGQVTNPTSEHPTVAHTRGATGRFTVTRIPDGPATGALATTGYDEAYGPSLWYFFPTQVATPYWLEADQVDLDITGDVDLGDVELTLGGAA
ncbi:collagen binding domain-containing protein [Nocardioides sp. MH1]|uniref:MSCRAMM family protein n=1 Tax=Nocardioides sp. MH1 TaxID=3242490 RepID=UPI0035224B10